MTLIVVRGHRRRGSGIAAGATGAASSATFINRDYASAAGGCGVGIVGTGFTGVPRVWFGAAQATAVGLVNGSLLVAVVPPYAGGNPGALGTAVDVYVEDKKMSPATFVYYPAPTTTYGSSTFEDGTLGTGFTTNITAGTVAASTDFAHAGTKSCKCNVTGSFAGSGAALAFNFSGATKNPAATGNGLWIRSYSLIPTATVNDVKGASNQMKLHLLRVGGTQPPNGWWMAGIGSDFPPSDGTLTIQTDFDTGSTYQAQTGQAFGDGTWQELTYFQYRTGGVGYLRAWVGGKLLATTSHASIGSDSATNQYDAWIGAAYSESTGALLHYVDDVVLANGAIDP